MSQRLDHATWVWDIGHLAISLSGYLVICQLVPRLSVVAIPHLRGKLTVEILLKMDLINLTHLNFSDFIFVFWLHFQGCAVILNLVKSFNFTQFLQRTTYHCQYSLNRRRIILVVSTNATYILYCISL